MLEAISSKNYLTVFAIIMIGLMGIVAYFHFQNQNSVNESWIVDAPTDGHVAKDEFIPISFKYTPSSSVLGNSSQGNFWLILINKKDGSKNILPFYPREIVGLIERNAVNAVHFGSKEFEMNTEHVFSGYAYLSPLIFDGEYSARLAFGRTEEGKSPTVLSEDEERIVTVSRMFQTRKSLIATTLSNEIKKNPDGSYTLLQFSLKAAVDDILFRGFEAGIQGIRRVPDPVISLALYDSKTGKKVSDLTNTKLGASTIEQFTPYVLDSELMIRPGVAENLELRASIDIARLSSNRDVSFSIPRLYGINTEQHKIAEQVPLKVVGKISK